MSLSLVQRKNLRDTQEALDAALARIQAATGVEYVFECDYGAVLAALSPQAVTSYGDRLGEVIHKNYMSGLAGNIDRFCKEPLLKEAFVEATSKKTIRFLLVKPDFSDTYQKTRVVDGVLELYTCPAKFPVNVDSSGSDLITSCSGSSPITLTARRAMANTNADLQKHLETIKEFSGIEFDFECDWIGMSVYLREKKYTRVDEIPETVQKYVMSGLAGNIKRFCADPILKEAFNEAFASKKLIRFVLEQTPWKDSAYWKTKNEDGVLVLASTHPNFPSNTDYAGNDFIKSLAGNGPLSLALRKNIADYTTKLTTGMETIKEATGLDFDFECDWSAIASLCKAKNYSLDNIDRLGETIYYIFTCLANNIKRFCQEDLLREAFIENCSEKKLIRFVVLPDSWKESAYYKTEMVDGVLVAKSCWGRFPANADDCGRDLIVSMSGSAVVTLSMRKNIADNQKMLLEALEVIKTALGVDFDYEVDWAAIVPPYLKRNANDSRIAEVAFYYLKELANKIKRFVENPIQKEQMLELCGKRIIRLNVQKEDFKTGNSYVQLRLVDSVLVITSPEKNFCCNVSETGNDLIVALGGEGPLFLRRRVDISNNQPNMVAALDKIEASTGLKFDFEVDWAAILPIMSEDYGNQCGSIVYGNYLKELATAVERLCKDDLAKEAFVERTSSKKLIRFVLDTKEKPNGGYVDCAFDADGTLIVHPCNVSETGRDIEKLL